MLENDGFHGILSVCASGNSGMEHMTGWLELRKEISNAGIGDGD